MATRIWAPSSDDILDLKGVYHRVDRFRFELCDQQLRPTGELHPDRDSPPSIQREADGSRRLSGLKLVGSEIDDINPLTDRLRVYMVLQNDVEYRLGTFLWIDASRPERSWGTEHTSELADFTHILSQKATRPYEWGRGAGPINLIIMFLCFKAGFELEDLAKIGDESRRSIAEPVTWAPGASWSDMLGDLGNLLGFVPPWFDRDGRMHFDQAPDPAIDATTVPPYGPGTRVIADSVVSTDDILNASNVWAVVDSGTDRLRVGRYTLPESAPHSYQKRGYRVADVENVQGLTSQAQADNTARKRARSAGDSFEFLTFNSTLDPRHDTYDVVDAFGKRWLETSWSMELRSGGAMSHTLKRTSYDVT